MICGLKAKCSVRVQGPLLERNAGSTASIEVGAPAAGTLGPLMLTYRQSAPREIARARGTPPCDQPLCCQNVLCPRTVCGSVGVTLCLLHISSLGSLRSLVFGGFKLAPKHLHWFALKFLRGRQVVLQSQTSGCVEVALLPHWTFIRH